LYANTAINATARTITDTTDQSTIFKNRFTSFLMNVHDQSAARLKGNFLIRFPVKS